MLMPWLKGHFVSRLGDFELDARLELPEQGVTALFGRSGSGKTTLLRCVAGLHQAEKGSLVVAGDVWQNDRFFMPVHRRPIGYVFQEASLLPHLSVKDNLCFGMNPKIPQTIPMDQVVELLSLEPLMSRSTDKLSGGERQRVAIGRALLTQPSLLLMDEPLSALDTQGKAEILPYLQTLTRTLKLPTLYVSHSLEEVSRLADRMLFLEGGRVKDEGKITEVIPRLPFSQSLGEEGAVLEARVSGHDPGHGLTYLSIGGHRLSVALRSAPVGDMMRVRVSARDVAVSMSDPKGSSMLNCLPVKLNEFELVDQDTRMMLKLQCGDALLLSKITRKSFDLLGLRAGMDLFAQIKSVALFQDEKLD